ncbi:hypothetical protein GCM10010195_44800 [Kitasatospora griseola]|nr:hypothetical protein GCM10010195_44800 [Kitasatospora griseola]
MRRGAGPAAVGIVQRELRRVHQDHGRAHAVLHLAGPERLRVAGTDSALEAADRLGEAVVPVAEEDTCPTS